MKLRNSIFPFALAAALIAAPVLADNTDNPKSPKSPYAGTVPTPQQYQPENTTPDVMVVPSKEVTPGAPSDSVTLMPATQPSSNSNESRIRPNPNDVPMFPPPDRDLKAGPN